MRVMALLLVVILLGPTVPAMASLGAGADVAAVPVASAEDPGDPVGPEAPWWTRWDRDRDGDRIDDALTRVDAAGPAAAYTPSGLRGLSFILTEDGVRFDVFVRFDTVPDARQVAMVEALVAPHGASVRLFALAEAVHVRQVSYAAVEALAALPDVRGVEADRTVLPFVELASKSALVGSSRELGNGGRARWGVTGHDRAIAVLDTGIDNEHPAFGIGHRFLGGYDATAWLAPPNPLAQTDPDSDDYATHGTHVAGIAVGVDPDLDHVGFAPDAHFLDVKVMARELGLGPITAGPGSLGTDHLVAGTGSSVITGMDFVARYNKDQTYLGDNTSARPIDVVVMSFGESVPDPNGTSTLARAVDRFVEETGIVVVAAAGNCGPDGRQGIVLEPCTKTGDGTIPAPASAEQAIAVGAMDDRETLTWADDEVAGFSSRGEREGRHKPDVMAYGVKIEAPRGDPRLGEKQEENLYQNLTGTSMAAPQVAGLVALMRESRPDLDPATIKTLLQETARPTGPADWDHQTGWGIINGYAAVGRADGNLTQDEVDAEYARLEGGFFGAGDHADHDHDHGDEARRTRDDGKVERNTTPPRRPANQPPNASFRVEPDEVVLGTPMRFYDESTDPDGDAIAARVWTFGDGSSAHGDALAHTYDRAGTFTVRLTVTDANETRNRTDTAKRVVTVLEPETRESPGPASLLMLGALGVLAGLVVSARRRQPPARPPAPRPSTRRP